MEKEATNDEKKINYIYEPPSILDIYKAEFTGDNKESIYKTFLLQRLPAIDVESGKITSNKIKRINLRRGGIKVFYDNFIKRIDITIDDLLERTINAQENEIPYSIKLEYAKDEDFRYFIHENYPGFAGKIETQLMDINKSDTYDLFYQFFINKHPQELRSTCIITDKQLMFQTTKHNVIDDIIERYDNGHLNMRDRYEEKTNIQRDEYAIIFGSPNSFESINSMQLPENGLSYSQYLFLSDYLNAYEDAKKELDDEHRKILENNYEKAMKDIKDELDSSLQSGFTVRVPNKNEVIIGKTRTFEERKKQIFYETANDRNIIRTIHNYENDGFYRELFNEVFSNGSTLERIWEKMDELDVIELWKINSNTKAFMGENGEFDFAGFYKKYMNDAYKLVQEKESEIKQYRSNHNVELKSIDRFERGQAMKSHIAKLEKKIQEIDNEIITIQRQNGALLPSLYKKQNIFQRMTSGVLRFFKRKDVATVKGKMEDLETRRKEKESEINEYHRQYNNLYIQDEEKFDDMTDEDLYKRKKFLMRDCKECQIRLGKIQDVLNDILKTGEIENNRDNGRVA